MVKVRFAPSPTGFLHIGGARTALFNWMYAKAQNGKFVLRIEDTDLQRSKQEYVDEILGSMKWLGLPWDEIYYQSERFDIYKKHAEQLVQEGKAYEQDGAVLLKTIPQEMKIYDLIRGEINFDTSNFVARDENDNDIVSDTGEPVLKDEVLIKKDGSPAYSFCCVVDDASMEISCVIRGEDHISNTPKQLLMYQALGFKPPKFAHLPLIMGEDRGRLSKRTGAVAVSDYKKAGFLPEAVVNYLMLLGWSPGNNQEIITLSSAVKKFSIKKVNKAAAVFSMDKLTWINGEYIKNLEVSKLTDMLLPFLDDQGLDYKKKTREELEHVVKLFQKRTPTLKDFCERAGFVFTDDYYADEQARTKYLQQDRKREFALLAERFQAISDFSADQAEKVFRALAEELGLKMEDLVHPVRVALTGSTVGPGLFETMVVIGKERTIDRLRKAFG